MIVKTEKGNESILIPNEMKILEALKAFRGEASRQGLIKATGIYPRNFTREIQRASKKQPIYQYRKRRLVYYSLDFDPEKSMKVVERRNRKIQIKDIVLKLVKERGTVSIQEIEEYFNSGYPTTLNQILSSYLNDGTLKKFKVGRKVLYTNGEHDPVIKVDKKEMIKRLKQKLGDTEGIKRTEKEMMKRLKQELRDMKGTKRTEKEDMEEIEKIDYNQVFAGQACRSMHDWLYERDYMTINFIERTKYDRYFKCENCQEPIPFYQKIYGFWNYRFCSEECRDLWKSVKENREKKTVCITCPRLKKCMASPDWVPDAKIA